MLDILERLAVREAVRRQPRQRRRICRLLMAGCTLAEVAERLALAESTVSDHLGKIRKSFIAMGFDGSVRTRRKKSSAGAVKNEGHCHCTGGEEQGQ